MLHCMGLWHTYLIWPGAVGVNLAKDDLKYRNCQESQGGQDGKIMQHRYGTVPENLLLR